MNSWRPIHRLPPPRVDAVATRVVKIPAECHPEHPLMAHSQDANNFWGSLADWESFNDTMSGPVWPRPVHPAIYPGTVKGIENIDWTGCSVRSDIAADPDASLLAVGFLGDVPVATAEAFRDYVENWMMGPGTVIEGDGALIHDSYTDRFVFPVVGIAGGVPVYAIDGYGIFQRQ